MVNFFNYPLLIILGVLPLSSGYTPTERGYGFFMVLEQVFRSDPDNLQNWANRYEDYQQQPNVTLSSRLFELAYFMQEGCRGTIAPGNSDGQIYPLFTDIITFSQSLIVDGSPKLIDAFEPVLDACFPDLSCSTSFNETTGWNLYMTVYMWYSTWCADGIAPAGDACLCEARNSIYNYVTMTSLAFQKKNATFDSCHLILKKCAEYDLLL